MEVILKVVISLRRQDVNAKAHWNKGKGKFMQINQMKRGSNDLSSQLPKGVCLSNVDPSWCKTYLFIGTYLGRYIGHEVIEGRYIR